MSLAGRHTIRRQSINVVFEGGESEGLALQGKVAALCRDWLAPALDEVFARAVPDGEHWRFDRIEVDAGRFTAATFERDFAAAVAAAVEQRMRDRPPREIAPARDTTEGAMEHAGRRTDAQSLHEAFLHFLATGALPWWYRPPEGRTLEQAVSDAWADGPVPGRLCTALPGLLAVPVARLRLARQFPAAFLGRLLEGLAPGALAALHEVAARQGWVEATAGPSRALPERAWEAAFACLASRLAVTERNLHQAWLALESAPAEGEPETARPSVAASMDPIERRTAGVAGTPPGHSPAIPDEAAESAEPARLAAAAAGPPVRASPAPAPSAPAATLDLAEGVFIDTAGIVLLHPFLPTLFERLGICADDRLLQPERALALLHFLATGATRAPEYALVLPKLLCGIAPSAPAGAPVELTGDEQAEALSLLDAAIGHWSALGDTSPDGLRGSFLVRPGKLSMRDGDDLLQVEHRAFDVLLGQLPWSIGPVLLPWMKRFLWVEWPF